MDVHIVGRHTKVAEEFRATVMEKVERISALAPRATRLDVHVVHERNPRIADERERVELTLHDRGPVIRVEAAAADRSVALELATDRIAERLRRQHERRAHRHQGKIGVGEAAALVAVPDGPAPSPAVGSVERWEGAPEAAVREIPLEGTPIVIRSKTHAAAPMTIADAIDQMELVGHDFFLFHDVETGLPSAVYRRRGWTVGVIHLERLESEGEDRGALEESA